MKRSFATLFRIMPLLAVCSCAIPQAVVVEEETPTIASQEEESQDEPVAGPEPPVIAGPPDDGIRLPDMLTLPSESEFRASRPTRGGQASDSGAVIARPPADP